MDPALAAASWRLSFVIEMPDWNQAGCYQSRSWSNMSICAGPMLGFKGLFCAGTVIVVLLTLLCAVADTDRGGLEPSVVKA